MNRSVRRSLLSGLILALAAAALVTRRLDAFTNPQFWAEDGTVWYAQAYNLGGLHALLIPYGGYYQTVSRLVAAVAVLVPVSWGPAITNGAGFVIQLLPLFFLLAGRLDHLVSTWRARLLLVVLYVGVPFSQEVYVNLTNSQWHLALLAVMVALAAQPRTWAWRAFDIAVIVLSGLTGPFVIILLPVLLLRLVLRREPFIATLTALSGLCALLQGLSLISHGRPGSSAGFDPKLIAVWVGGQVGAGTFLGERLYRSASSLPHWSAVVALIAVGVAALWVWAIWRGPLEMRMLALWGALLIAAVFIAGEESRAEILIAGPGNRYRTLPGLVLSALLLSLFQRGRGWVKVIPGILIATTLLIATPLDWIYPPFHDYQFQRQAVLFERSPPGTAMRFQLNPSPWSMVLVRRR